MSDGQNGPHTLGIDIGGTGLKAAVLDATGKMVVKRVRVPTPSPATPSAVLDALASLIKPLPPFDRISIGFPGVVRRGTIPRPDRRTDAWRRAVAIARIAEAGAPRLLPRDVLWYHANYVAPGWGRRPNKGWPERLAGPDSPASQPAIPPASPAR